MPSRLFIYYNSRLIEGDVNTDGGAQIKNAIKSIATYGYCSEKEWVYDPSKYRTKPSAQAYAIAKTSRLLIISLLILAPMPMLTLELITSRRRSRVVIHSSSDLPYMIHSNQNKSLEPV